MEFSNNDLPERPWPSIPRAGADSLACRTLGILAMDLPVELTGKRKESTASSNYILSGRPLYKVALQTRRFCLKTSGLSSKEWFNNKTNWWRPRGLSVPLTSMTSFSTAGNYIRQHYVSPHLHVNNNCSSMVCSQAEAIIVWPRILWDKSSDHTVKDQNPHWHQHQPRSALTQETHTVYLAA